MTADINKKILVKGEEIFSNLGGTGKSVFNRDWWYGKIMEWSMQNADFKTQLFHFVDVLPMLTSGKEVAQHLREYFAQADGKLPGVFNFGLGVGSLAPSLMATTIKNNVTQMAKLFITGENTAEALPRLIASRKKPMAFTLDLLGEACLSEDEALSYQQQYQQLMAEVVKASQSWQKNPQIDHDHWGQIPTVNVSVKLTAIYSQIQIEDWEKTKIVLKERLRPILDQAMENFVFVNIDMEKFAVKDLTLAVFKELLMEEKYRSYRHWGIVVQAYLRDSYRDLQDLVVFAQQRGTPFSVRLVKGAYWDYETIGALQKNWPIPVYSNKAESDFNYEQCTAFLLQNHQLLSLAVASHNVRTIAHAMVMAEELNVPKNAFEIQMLYGMAEPIKQAIIKQGYRLREYCPVGDLLPGMSYLVRRLLENTSNQSFLRSKFVANEENTKLLRDPAELRIESSPVPKSNPELFSNAPFEDFSRPGPRAQMVAALQKFKAENFNKTWQSFIAGADVKAETTIPIENPSTGEVIGQCEMGTITMADQAMGAASAAYKSWATTPVATRAQLLEKVADLLARDKFKLMACEVYEAGKTWKEADGDICEAIDFCRYYAKDMRRLAEGRRVGHAPGEASFYKYTPRGVNVIIAPWNFPLAILTGMVAGAVVTGNTVVMKPAEQTPMIARYLMDAFSEAGIPKGVVNLLFGHGHEVGEYLVGHKETTMIAFTGSKEVGLKIMSKASQYQPGQVHLKRTLTELGGKNAIIVDGDADLDEAVAGVVYSAFGFQGQKCSACSRVIVLENVYDRFVDRLVAATKSLQVGPAEDPGSVIGPVIDRAAKNKIETYISMGENSHELLYKGEVPSQGFFVPPTIFAGVPPDAPLAQQEIFGPVLSVIKVNTFTEALAVANGTEYALTGAVYSRSPDNLALAKEEFVVGNLYINRGCTAALVDRHPFGGFKMSGGGSKTGGPEYLLHFLDPRVVTENTLRRGFSPDLPN